MNSLFERCGLKLRKVVAHTCSSLVVGVAAVASLLFVVPGEAVATETVNVPPTKALIYNNDQSFGSIIIGNDKIIQVVITDDKTLVLKGKGIGTTNLILMDKDGAIIKELNLVVGEADDGMLTVNRYSGGTLKSARYVCNPQCTLQGKNDSKDDKLPFGLGSDFGSDPSKNKNSSSISTSDFPE